MTPPLISLVRLSNYNNPVSTMNYFLPLFFSPAGLVYPHRPLFSFRVSRQRKEGEGEEGVKISAERTRLAGIRSHLSFLCGGREVNSSSDVDDPASSKLSSLSSSEEEDDSGSAVLRRRCLFFSNASFISCLQERVAIILFALFEHRG